MGPWKLLLEVKSSQRRLWPLGKGVGDAGLAERAVAVMSWGNGTWAPGRRVERSLSTSCPCPWFWPDGDAVFQCTSLLWHGGSGIRAGLLWALPSSTTSTTPSLCWLAVPRPHRQLEWSYVGFFSFLFHIKWSWILVTMETSSPNYKEFDSLDVESYNSSFSLRKTEIKKTS